jgi:transaldolase
MNPLKQLQDCGQSIWLDYIRRDLITSGEFQRLVEQDGMHGVTSNPTIAYFPAIRSHLFRA